MHVRVSFKPSKHRKDLEDRRAAILKANPEMSHRDARLAAEGGRIELSGRDAATFIKTVKSLRSPQ